MFEKPCIASPMMFVPITLPTTYLQALSYQDCLFYMADVVKQINVQFDALNQNLEGMIDARIDSKFEDYLQALQKAFDTFKAQIEAENKELAESLQKQIDDIQETLKQMFGEFEKEVNGKLETFDERIKEQTEYLHAQIVILQASLDMKNEEMKAYVASEINRLEGKINALEYELPPIYNPIKDAHTSITQAIQDIYDSLRYGGLTALEYDALGLTAEEYDNVWVNSYTQGMTATEYDLCARFILGWFDRFHKMYSPFTGEKEEIQFVVARICSEMTEHNLTASEYDALGLTATKFDEESLSAYDYDWNGKILESAK